MIGDDDGGGRLVRLGEVGAGQQRTAKRTGQRPVVEHEADALRRIGLRLQFEFRPEAVRRQ
jgi:hypothetical protein